MKPLGPPEPTQAASFATFKFISQNQRKNTGWAKALRLFA
jgi:hypothetical protein